MPHQLSRRSLLSSAAATGLGLAATATLPVQSAKAGPEADLWDRWMEYTPRSTVQVDNSLFDEILKQHRHLSPDNVSLINYADLKGRDESSLNRYLDLLQDTDVDSLSRAEQFAYWGNFYNALTLKVIIDHYPVASIRDIDISPGFFSNGPWGAKLVTVMGEDLSLDDMEHRILRPIWRDPRVHYVVNCASIGCANIQAHAWRARTLYGDLNTAAADYVNHPRGASVIDGELKASTIYSWFVEDFDVDGGVVQHFKQYGSPALKSQLADITRVSDYDYDWALNDYSSAG